MIPSTISVGILLADTIQFNLQGNYTYQGQTYNSQYTISAHQHHLLFNGTEHLEILLTPTNPNTCSFELQNVTIGIDFHWQKQETQRFRGSLKFIVEDGKVRAINIIRIDDYLTSVISSEMNANSSLELLKAHAVISRSWLLRPFSTSQQHTPTPSYQHPQLRVITKWYERDAHTNFDICADDHCQRYQGITKVTAPNATLAVQATAGEVLTYNNEICDARFYKSCGGATETFEHCWDNQHHPYLTTIADTPDETLPYDLSTEQGARQWIESTPPAFCNTHNRQILNQVLNDFDQTTNDYYRWQIQYTQQELSNIIRQRSGIDFGTILQLIPMQRGTSGRIEYLQIVGTKQTLIVGKELEIRKWLSHSHLYSSAFIVNRQADNFILRGAGWGHGVGLCQIGAALMSHQGYNYQQILTHYYQHAQITKIY